MDAELDEKGEPIKIVCDVLEVLTYVIDSQTSPMSALTVTFARVDPSNDFMKAGPQTQHLITGEELIIVLATPGGITIEAIEESVLRTGIPGAAIKPEDLAPYEGPKPKLDWYGRMIEDTRRKLEELKNVPPPPIPGMMPMMPGSAPLAMTQEPPEDDA